MFALEQWWVIAGTASLALALEMIWFSTLGFGSWVNTKEPDQLEKFVITRFILSLVSFIVIAILVMFALDLGLKWWQLLIVGNGLILAVYIEGLPRRKLSIKPLLAELGFISLLLTVITYVIAVWPW